jgi:hypothetical protein
MTKLTSGSTRRELLGQVRELLKHDPSLADASDDALANYVIEFAPPEVPTDLRVRLRDLDVLTALKALRDEETEAS